MRTRTTNTNTTYRYTPALSAAANKKVATVSDLVAFLANPGDLAHRENRKTEAYVEARNKELVFFCQHLRQQFGKRLSGDDFKQVTRYYSAGWEGATPLHIAACYRSPDVLRHMLQDNPEALSALNQTDNLGRTVLDWAEMRSAGKNRDAIVSLLTTHHAVHGSNPLQAKQAPRSIRTSPIGPSVSPHAMSDFSGRVIRMLLTHQSLNTTAISAKRRRTDNLHNEKGALAKALRNTQAPHDLPGPAHTNVEREADVPVQRSGAQAMGTGTQQLRTLRENNTTWRDDMKGFRKGWLEASRTRPLTTSATNDQTHVNTSTHSIPLIETGQLGTASQERSHSGSVTHLSAENIVFSASEDKLRECANSDHGRNQGSPEALSPGKTLASPKAKGVNEAHLHLVREHKQSPHSDVFKKNLPPLGRQVNKAQSQYNAPPSTAPDRLAYQTTLHPLTHKEECTRHAALQTRLSNLADRIKKDNPMAPFDPEYVTLLNDIDKALGHGIQAQTPRRLSRFNLGRATSKVVLNERVRDANSTMQSAVERIENQYRLLRLGELIQAAEKFYAPLDEQTIKRHDKYRPLAPKTIVQLDLLTDRRDARIAALLPKASIETARALRQTPPTEISWEAVEKCMNSLKAAQQNLANDLELNALQRARADCALAFLQLGSEISLMYNALQDLESAAKQICQPLVELDIYCMAQEVPATLDSDTAAIAEALDGGVFARDPSFLITLNQQRETNFKTLRKLTVELKKLKGNIFPSE